LEGTIAQYDYSDNDYHVCSGHFSPDNHWIFRKRSRLLVHDIDRNSVYDYFTTMVTMDLQPFFETEIQKYGGISFKYLKMNYEFI
jgi:hypothetical protein